MTLEQFMACPRDMSIEEWDAKLKRMQKLERKMSRLADKIQECEDALDVLSDEKGSERWHKWDNKLCEYKATMDLYMALYAEEGGKL